MIESIDATHSDAGKRSAAFDFPFRKALYQAVAWGDYHFLKYHDRAAGVMGVWSDKAVTFLENHDTEEARNSEYAPPFPGPDHHGDQMLQGYAVILTHPGTPSVFWRDIYDSNSSLENRLRGLIQIRKQYCVHSESRVFVDSAKEGEGYAAYIQGDRGELAVEDWTLQLVARRSEVASPPRSTRFRKRLRSLGRTRQVEGKAVRLIPNAFEGSICPSDQRWQTRGRTRHRFDA